MAAVHTDAYSTRLNLDIQHIALTGHGIVSVGSATTDSAAAWAESPYQRVALGLAQDWHNSMPIHPYPPPIGCPRVM